MPELQLTEPEKKLCYICPSNKYVDDHHIDCCEGKLSPETVPLCRRCHRTYHDLGVDYFEDEYLDKAIEIENKRRQIVYNSLSNPVKRLELFKREDVKRSYYWNKAHGIKSHRSSPWETEEAKQLGFDMIDKIMGNI